MLLISEQEVETLLDTGQVIEAIRVALHAWAADRAVNIPRGRLKFGTVETGRYWLNCIPGAVEPAGVAAVRVDSVKHRPLERVGYVRGGMLDHRYSGLVLLYSIETGEMLAMIQDFVLSGYRVGATSAIVTDRLARPGPVTVALYGSGKQAGYNLRALAAVRPVREVRVFSPQAAHCEAFAATMSEELGVPVRAAADPDSGLDGADVVLCATNGMRPVFRGELLRPGMHVTTIAGADHTTPGRREIDDATLAKADVIVLNSHDSARIDNQQDVLPAVAARGWEHLHEVPALIGGRIPGRTSPEQITLYINNVGLGIQFAAVGALAYRLARAAGMGRELPTEWFMSDVSEWEERGFHSSP